MSKVTSQIHQSDVLCRQEVTVELTDVTTQAELTPGNALRDIGFTNGGGGSRGMRVAPKKAPNPPGKAPSVVRPLACSGVFSTRTFVGYEEVAQSAAITIRKQAAPGQTDVRLTGLVSRSATRKAETERSPRSQRLHRHRGWRRSFHCLYTLRAMQRHRLTLRSSVRPCSQFRQLQGSNRGGTNRPLCK